MKSPARFLVLSLAALPATAMPAAAAKITVPVETVLNVALGCQIQQMKVMAVTNTTHGTIAAGTRIQYTYERYPDHAAITGSLASAQLAPGQTEKRGLAPAYSCKAWFRRVPALAQ